ncbi:MAG: LPS assembly lipoprotein LptE [Hydrogenophaga sp.]|jgi:LPS-assembly lipoprotein|uniref:LPS-assembly lipoprotein LptE n=1 Tax=Hydrogenophaga sp. TaxID=1904254 RepID=UPI0027662408|nr:LPS assembly lipoprotein LptE [Hydrogenophaga sp.]
MQVHRPSTNTATRRRALQQLAAGVALIGLSGCGYKLRQAPKFAFDSVRIAGNESTPVSRELRSALLANGLQVLTTATPAAGAPAQVVLTVVTDQRERVAVGQTAAGQVRELQLRTRFTFRLRTAADKELIEDTELLLERDLSFSETAVLSKDAEEALLYRDMATDLVQQVVRRLAAVKSL